MSLTSWNIDVSWSIDLQSLKLSALTTIFVLAQYSSGKIDCFMDSLSLHYIYYPGSSVLPTYIYFIVIIEMWVT
jgi:hypothetical protein